MIKHINVDDIDKTKMTRYIKKQPQLNNFRNIYGKLRILNKCEYIEFHPMTYYGISGLMQLVAMGNEDKFQSFNREYKNID